MSQKIRSKDLSYDSNLPPFLQRLRGQHVGREDSDRHEHQIARPRKAKVAEDEDEPTIVDESGELVTKQELEKLNDVADKLQDAKSESESKDRALSSSATKQAHSNTAGVAKKRKIVKAIGDDEGESDHESKVSSKKIKPVKKKAKPIKLAFEEEEND